MADVDNVVPEHLRHIRGAVDALRDDMREVKGRLGGRVERIEQRLSLTDA